MAGVTEDLDGLATRFAEWGPLEFAPESPLYQTLSPLVAHDTGLLELVAQRTPGQQPTILFFAAVHHLVLRGGEHPFRAYFASVVGDGVLPPTDAGPAFLDFCAVHRDELASLLATRLVQTNVVKRSAALRLGLSVVAKEVAAVRLIEIGSSAGIHLRHDRYRYILGPGAVFGHPGSPVEISTAWRGAGPVPNLDAVPSMIDTVGIDLNPIVLGSEDDRQWLQALVWPENRVQAAQLQAALEVVAADPPRLLRGDAAELCPSLAAELPAGEPRVVFHAATRGHVHRDRREAFDLAIAALGQDAPLFVLSLEGPRRGEPRLDVPHHVLTLRTPDGDARHLACVDGHAHWIQPLD